MEMRLNFNLLVAHSVEVFGGIHRRLRGVGLGSIACGFMGVTYYSMLIAWVIHAFFDSFGKNSFWAGEDLTGDEALTYFFEDITGTATVGDDLKPTRLVWANVGYSLIVWAIIFLCVTFGVKVTGQITYFTVGAPILLLFVFLVRSLTLEGASMGVSQYLSTDWSVLSDRPDIWVKATGQIFFSLSIAFGAMTAYASHCPRDEPAVRNSVVIALSNSLVSWFSLMEVERFPLPTHLTSRVSSHSCQDLLSLRSWAILPPSREKTLPTSLSADSASSSARSRLP